MTSDSQEKEKDNIYTKVRKRKTLRDRSPTVNHPPLKLLPDPLDPIRINRMRAQEAARRILCSIF